ncbi:MAG: hypothetical protein COA66_13220 [Arcobacter sp.]|nr:MAG: hypothetical protein COA66_13220 [Arcobacter sp.]
MIKLIKQASFVLIASTLLLSTGCAYQKPMETTPSNTDEPTVNKAIKGEILKVNRAKKRMEVSNDMSANVTRQISLEQTITSLATQMMQNKKFNSFKPVLITSFVRLDNFKKTTEFGRIIGESLINELSNRNFNVIEFRGQLAVSINAQGEYYISRNIKKLKDKIENTYVVVGTYSRQFEKVMLNARVIDNESGRIISSARATYLHGLRNDCVLFKDCKPARKISIVKE